MGMRGPHHAEAVHISGIIYKLKQDASRKSEGMVRRAMRLLCAISLLLFLYQSLCIPVSLAHHADYEGLVIFAVSRQENALANCIPISHGFWSKKRSLI